MGITTKYKIYLAFSTGIVALGGLGALQNFTPKIFDSVLPSQKNSLNSSTVWVAKPDGSESCSPESGFSLGQGSAELAKLHIPVLDSKKGRDGKLHIEMCGAPKGTTNLFLIPREKLPDAVLLGYKEVKN